MTNATKANAIAAVNAALTLIVSFGVNVTDAQQAAITGAVNAALVLWISLTYRSSAKRVPDQD